MGARSLYYLIVAIHYVFACYFDWYYVDLPEKLSPKYAGKLKHLTYINAMGARSLYYLIVAIHYVFACFFDWYFVDLPEEFCPKYAGKLKFLTYIDAIIQSIYFTLAYLTELTTSNDPRRTSIIRTVKDIWFCSLAFPMGLFVATSFWGIYAVDRELILPKTLDAVFPPWLNHIMHTNVGLLMLVELMTSRREYPSRKVGVTILTAFITAYLVWVHVIYNVTGKWVYPILQVLNLPLRIVFFAVAAFVGYLFYRVGETVNSFRSGSSRQAGQGRKRKVK